MKFQYVSLFSGAGGLDIGLERAGLSAVSVCEIERVFCETLKSNQGWVHSDGHSYLKQTKLIHADIREVKPRDLYSGGGADLVVGGPPCQAFSSSGKQLSVLDPRGALVKEFYRVVDALRPKMFLFENVRGLVTARDRKGEPGGVITELIHILEEIGYSCRAGLLNSADYGANQRRVRCFIVGSLKGAAPNFPQASHEKGGNVAAQKWRSLREFLNSNADLNRDNFTFPTAQLSRQLMKIPGGSGIKSRGKAETTRPGGHWGYRQGTFIADLNLPARTVTGSASQDWVRWKGLLRRLTFNEVKGLQGFPKDWILNGTKAQQYKQIGNAVPTIVGEALGKMIVQHLKNYPKGKAIQVGLPDAFKGYIEYTKKDHARNKSSRSVHRAFSSPQNTPSA